MTWFLVCTLNTLGIPSPMPTPSFLEGRDVTLGTDCIRLSCILVLRFLTFILALPRLLLVLVSWNLFLMHHPIGDISAIVQTDRHMCSFSVSWQFVLLHYTLLSVFLLFFLCCKKKRKTFLNKLRKKKQLWDAFKKAVVKVILKASHRLPLRSEKFFKIIMSLKNLFTQY